jgi:hypothetical protein
MGPQGMWLGQIFDCYVQRALDVKPFQNKDVYQKKILSFYA